MALIFIYTMLTIPNINKTKDISSTVVRNYIKDKKDISEFIPNKVLKFIENNNLYF